MKQNHIVSKIAIYLLAVVLIIFGIYHLKNPYDMVVYVPEFLPGGILWVYLTGVAFILVGASFLTNRFVKVAGYILAALLLVFVLTIHIPNAINAGDASYRQIALINALKDTALMGFALHIAASAHDQHLHFEESD
jgi:uncharacterized membrane protein